MEFLTGLLILINHADGIIACLVWFSCFNGNIDGINGGLWIALKICSIVP